LIWKHNFDEEIVEKRRSPKNKSKLFLIKPTASLKYFLVKIKIDEMIL